MNKNILIFCPDVEGHRQNYVCVLAKWFLRNDMNVLVAVGQTASGASPREAHLLKMLANHPNVEIIDLGDTTGSHLIRSHWVYTLSELENRYCPKWTVLPTGDELRISLDGLGKLSRPGELRRVALFIYVNHYYWRNTVGMPVIEKLRTAVRWYRQRRKEIVYFKEDVWKAFGLDLLLTTNPDFIEKASEPRIAYIPEIYRAWGFEESRESHAIKKLCQEYGGYINTHRSKEVIFYYGDWCKRRGYDILLKLACENRDTVFVSLGRPSLDNAFEYDVPKMRDKLNCEGRIFEIELPFLPENDLVDMLFASVNFVILPYRAFYGMSGSLIQSASYGKPVIVPNIGYLGARAQRDGLGMSFRHGDMDDLRVKFTKMRSDYQQFLPSVHFFAKQFDISEVDRCLEHAFENSCGRTRCV